MRILIKLLIKNIIEKLTSRYFHNLFLRIHIFLMKISNCKFEIIKKPQKYKLIILPIIHNSCGLPQMWAVEYPTGFV